MPERKRWKEGMERLGWGGEDEGTVSSRIHTHTHTHTHTH